MTVCFVMLLPAGAERAGAQPATFPHPASQAAVTGAWSEAGALTADAQGQIKLPACSTANDDWGLSLARE